MSNKLTIKRIFGYIKKYGFLVFLSLLFSMVSVILTLYVPILIGEAIDCITDGGIDWDGVKHNLLMIVIAMLITAVAQWFMNLINNKITYNVVRDIRLDAFHKLEKLPLAYIDSHAHGQTVSRIITDVDQFADGLLMGFTQLFSGVITILGTLLFMLWLNIKITIVVVCITPVSLFVASFIAKKTYDGDISFKQLENIKDIVEFAKEKGIEVIFYYSPIHVSKKIHIYTKNEWDSHQELKRQLAQIISFYDYSLFNEYNQKPLDENSVYFISHQFCCTYPNLNTVSTFY